MEKTLYMKNNGILIKVLFFTSFVFTTTGSMLKIFHWNGARTLMAIGLLASISFILLSIFEVANSKTITKNEKWMWIVGLILISPIVGLIYIVSGQKRILRTKKLNAIKL